MLPPINLLEVKDAPLGVSCAIEWNYTERVWEGTVNLQPPGTQSVAHLKSAVKPRVLLAVQNGNLDALKADMKAHVVGLSKAAQ
jgi:hypothetical protein